MGVEAAAIISVLSTVAGTALRAQGARQAAKAEADAAEYNRDLALRESRREAARQRREARRAISAQRVALAKSGVLLEGSPLDLLSENAAELEREALETEQAGRNSASLESFRARNVRSAGRRQATSAIVGGTGRLAGLGYSFLGKKAAS